MDSVSLPQPDVVHDFDVFPFPFANNNSDEVKLFNSHKHFDDFLVKVRELHRSLNPGGLLRVLSSHYSGPGVYRDPTHKVLFPWTTVGRFIAALGYRTEGEVRFAMRRRMFGVPDGGTQGPGALVKAFDNRYPDLYERYFCWMMPAKAMYCELEAIKD